jgi:CheY-like chemotaxis protein
MNKILVVDDEKDLCELVKKVLEKTGKYKVDTISDPEKVIEVCRQLKPDLILLDIVMPNLKGTELIQILKGSPQTMKIYIIVTSGLGEMVYRLKEEKWHWEPNRPIVKTRGEVIHEKHAARAAEAYGVDDFLAKPFSPDTLRQVIDEVFSRRKYSEENGRED